MENKKPIYVVRYTIQKENIMAFLSSLHETQFNLIEAVVESREKQGFPEASIMIKSIMEKSKMPIVIDLTGPQGNSFYLMGFAQKNAERLGLDCSTILKEMKSGDYENLVTIFEKYFGKYVILER